MAKERSKDKGGTLNGQSKSANNNRSPNGKIKDSKSTQVVNQSKPSVTSNSN